MRARLVDMFRNSREEIMRKKCEQSIFTNSDSKEHFNHLLTNLIEVNKSFTELEIKDMSIDLLKEKHLNVYECDDENLYNFVKKNEEALNAYFHLDGITVTHCININEPNYFIFSWY